MHIPFCIHSLPCPPPTTCHLLRLPVQVPSLVSVPPAYHPPPSLFFALCSDIRYGSLLLLSLCLFRRPRLSYLYLTCHHALSPTTISISISFPTLNSYSLGVHTIPLAGTASWSPSFVHLLGHFLPPILGSRPLVSPRQSEAHPKATVLQTTNS